MDNKAKELAEKHYRLVGEMMEKYGLSENDVPDWHGALSEGLCVAAACWGKIDNNDDPIIYNVNGVDEDAVFEAFAVPYMIVAAIKERPLQAVLGKVLAMRDDLDVQQLCLLFSLCFREGDDETISILTAESKAVLNGQTE